MIRDQMYLCDPEINTGCHKKFCAYSSAACYPSCISTIHPELAQHDAWGRPIKTFHYDLPEKRANQFYNSGQSSANRTNQRCKLSRFFRSAGIAVWSFFAGYGLTHFILRLLALLLRG